MRQMLLKHFYFSKEFHRPLDIDVNIKNPFFTCYNFLKKGRYEKCFSPKKRNMLPFSLDFNQFFVRHIFERKKNATNCCHF